MGELDVHVEIIIIYMDWKSLDDVECPYIKVVWHIVTKNGCSMVKKLISLVIFQLKVQ